MNFPLVTVVTPSFNQGQFIRATIESVLGQDYPRLEYIVMDGGSTDQTADVVRDYASRLKWISEPDRGQSHAINKGFRMAKGEIVTWLNSDDLMLPGAISKVIPYFQRDPSVRAVYGEGYLIDREGRITGRFPHTRPFDLWRLVYLSDYILQQTVYFDRRVFAEVGYLDESLHYTMDWDILIRIGKRYGLTYIPEFLGCLREYPEAKSFSGGAVRAREIARLLYKHTGKILAPGTIVYGLETYRQIWCAAIGRLTPRWLRRPSAKLQRLIHVAAGYCIERALQSQGLYPGGWAGKRVHWMTPPPGPGRLVIRGEVRDCFGRRQRLALRVNGRLMAKARLAPGAFELCVPIPDEWRERPLDILLKAERGLLDRVRFAGRLAYRLEEITIRRSQPDVAPRAAASAETASRPGQHRRDSSKLAGRWEGEIPRALGAEFVALDGSRDHAFFGAHHPPCGD